VILEHIFCYNYFMAFWYRLLYILGLRNDPGPRSYELDATLLTALEDLALRERRPANEVVSELVASGLDRRFSQDDLLQRWQSLSPREQDVSALACTGYTNQQIAVRLSISPETVKTHLHNAMVKFNLHSRSELRLLLAAWDFSAWERQR
jgi:DNA-binding CsgD family transcriptional regulator